MCEHRTLGPTRCSRRVENGQGVVVTPLLLRFLFRRLPDHGLVRFGPVRRVIVDGNQVLCGDAVPDRIYNLGELLAEDEDLCFTVGEDVLDFRSGQAVVDRDEDRADLAQPEVHVIVLRFVQRKDPDPIPVGHAQGPHRVHESICPIVQLLVRTAYVLANQPFPVRGHGCTLGQKSSYIDPHGPSLRKRLSTNGHLRRCTRPSSLGGRECPTSFLRISCALHLTISRQPLS